MSHSDDYDSEVYEPKKKNIKEQTTTDKSKDIFHLLKTVSGIVDVPEECDTSKKKKRDCIAYGRLLNSIP